MNKYCVYTVMILLIPFGQNCSQPFNVQDSGLGEMQKIASVPTDTTPGVPTTPTTMPTTPTTVPTTPTTIPTTPTTMPTTPTTTPPVVDSGQKVLVTIGVGVGGRRISGIDGFKTIIADHEAFSQAMQDSIKTDPNDPTKLICPTGTSQMGGSCCFRQYECIGGGWHSDWLFRAVAYGNGMFVAVGGASFGIIQTTTDGVAWSPKLNTVAGSGVVTGVRTSTTWLSGVAYGNGRFVAVDGRGVLIFSTDGKKWESTSGPFKGTYLRRLTFVGNKFYASGDGGIWGISTDGSAWDQMGSTGGVSEITKVGAYYYGVSGNSLYRSDLKDPNVWQEVYMHSAAPSFVFNPLDSSFNLLSSKTLVSTLDPLSTWTSVYQAGPGRWVHHNGVYFTGMNGSIALTSVNGKTWISTPSPLGYKQTVCQIASGLVSK